MKVEFEGKLIESLDQFWVNWQMGCYKQACENWAEKKEVLEFINHGVDDAVLDDFLKRKAGDIYMDKVFSKKIHTIPAPTSCKEEEVYESHPHWK